MNVDQGLFVPLPPRASSRGLPNSYRSRRPRTCCWPNISSASTVPGRVFEVLIQLGAILAIVVVYFERLLGIAARCHRPQARRLRFILGVVLASLPAAIAGVLLHDFIKTVIYETPDHDLRVADRRRHHPALCRPAEADAQIHRHLQLPAAALPLYRAVPDAGAGAGRVALGRHHRRLAADGHRQALGRRVHLLHRHAADGRRLRLRSLQEPRHDHVRARRRR